MPKKQSIFYGWWIAIAGAVTYGIAQGIPYYNVSFFYDYFQRSFGWSRSQITLGFPLAALLTIWVGPVLVPRFSQRKLILFGTALTAAALAGFAWMHGSLWVYFALWGLYTLGYLLSGPIPHQLIISHWFRKRRGTAMGILYFGVGVIGSLGSYAVKPLTDRYGYQAALFALALAMFAGWPLVLWVLRDRPQELGLTADGEPAPLQAAGHQGLSIAQMMQRRAFWLLLAGSICSIATVGAISQHVKFIFLDAGFARGSQLDSAWRSTSILILCASTVGRLFVGLLADWWSTKYVMVLSFFLTAASAIPLLLLHPPHVPVFFGIIFGVAMGADYMLIPLMVAEEFGLSSLAAAMSVVLPINTVAQTWFPYLVAVLREHSSSYRISLYCVIIVAVFGAISIAALPSRRAQSAA
ncbi:MAG: MFS transporter [Terriglobus sp.]